MADFSVHTRLRALAAVARSIGLSILLLLAATPAVGAGVNLAWDPVLSPPATGYKIHYGPSAGNYPSQIDVGNTTTRTVTGLTEGATYHFVVTAYAPGYTESGFSNDVGTTVPYSAPVAQFTGTPTTGTSPLTVNFSNTSSGTITSYAWTFGDGGVSTAVAPSHVYTVSGTYTVRLTVTGPGGSNTQTRTNYVTVNPPAPVAQFTGAPTAGTAPLTVSFSNTSTGTITSYAWTFGDGGTSTLATPSHLYSNPGTYSVALTVNGPGGSNTQTRTNYVSVATLPDVGLYRKTTAGVQPPYRFILDYNVDHAVDAQIPYGAAGDMPLVGYLAPGGKSSLIVYRNGIWNIDTNRDGVTNTVVPFGGVAGDIPLTANFSGPGQLDDIVIYRAGMWYVDTDLNGTANLTYMFGGVPGDIPVAGDVNGDGMADIGIYRNGFWYIDTNRNGTADMTMIFGGLPQDIPLLFDWNGDGKADLCLFRDGMWYVSTKRDGVADVIFGYGAAGDLPQLGKFH